jgi:hypothetical protein
MTFRDLAIGDRFTFSPGVWTFSRACTKISARRYLDSSGLEYRVGTITVGVKLADDAPDEHWREDGDDAELFMGGY